VVLQPFNTIILSKSKSNVSFCIFKDIKTKKQKTEVTPTKTMHEVQAKHSLNSFFVVSRFCCNSYPHPLRVAAEVQQDIA